MPDIEKLKRKAQNAAYTATEKAQAAAASAGERADSIREYAGEKAGAIREYAGGKASAIWDYAGEKAGAIRDYAGEKATAVREYTGEKAGTLKDAARVNMALANEKRKLGSSFRALGEWYAARCGENPPEAVADIVREIRRSQKRIAELRSSGAVDEEPPAGTEALQTEEKRSDMEDGNGSGS